MKKILLIAILSILPLWGHAQSVYKTEDGKVFLDCSPTSRMPQGAVTTVSKVSDGQTEAEHKQVYQKLEVATTDLIYVTWDWAYSECKGLAGGTNKWRLPTQRELQLLYLFRNAFASLGAAFQMDGSVYWSLTVTFVNGVVHRWAVDFESGLTGLILPWYDGMTGAGAFAFARCVREVRPL